MRNSYLFLNLEFPLTKKLQVKLSALHIKGIYEMWIWSVFSTHCYILQTLHSEIASAGSPLSNKFNTKNVFLVIYTEMRTVISNNYTIMLTVLLNKGISYLNSTHSNQFLLTQKVVKTLQDTLNILLRASLLFKNVFSWWLSFLIYHFCYLTHKVCSFLCILLREKRCCETDWHQ